MPLKDPIVRAEYHKRYMKEIWYPKNRAKQKASSLVAKQRVLKFIREYKLTKGCRDCGYNSHAEALDFDHLSNNKLFTIAQAGRLGAGMERVKREIQKCDVVCANCHRVRTAKRLKREGGEVSSEVS